MISIDESTCPKCGGELKYYDRVNRIVRTRYSKHYNICLRRLRCLSCRSVHREIPDAILPYKQYEAEVIRGVVEGLITNDILGFENYPL